MQEQALVATRRERDRVANLLKTRYEVLVDRKAKMAEENKQRHQTAQTRGTRDMTLKSVSFLKGSMGEVRRMYKEVTGRELVDED